MIDVVGRIFSHLCQSLSTNSSMRCLRLSEIGYIRGWFWRPIQDIRDSSTDEHARTAPRIPGRYVWALVWERWRHAAASACCCCCTARYCSVASSLFFLQLSILATRLLRVGLELTECSASAARFASSSFATTLLLDSPTPWLFFWLCLAARGCGPSHLRAGLSTCIERRILVKLICAWCVLALCCCSCSFFFLSISGYPYSSILLFSPNFACIAVSSRLARGAQRISSRSFSGLKDQDRIFQNIYGEHDLSIQGAMKRGDWYQTDKIVQKARIIAYIHTEIQTHMPTPMHTYTSAYTDMHTHTRRAHMHTHSITRTLTHTHIQTPTHIHANTHTHSKHMQARTHAQNTQT